MKIDELSIYGCYQITNVMHPDDRGNFFEWFSEGSFSKNSLDFSVAQASFSISLKNVIRGIHYSTAEIGQSKIVMCSSGLINDVIVDLRIGSPTFLAVQNVTLSPDSGKVLYIPTGVGHGFSVLSESASLTYLLSSQYLPSHEYTIQAFDESLAINWNLSEAGKPIMSIRDETAMSLEQAMHRDLLPKYETQN